MASYAAGKRKLSLGAEAPPFRVPIRATDDFAGEPQHQRTGPDHEGRGHRYEDVTIGGVARTHMGDVSDSSGQARDQRQGPDHECRGHRYEHVRIGGSSRMHMGDIFANTVNNNYSAVNQHSAEGNRREDFLDALAFDAMDSRRSVIDPAYGDTCRWVLQTEAFVRWRDPALRKVHRGFLWIKGKAGVGKSTIMKFMLEHVEHSMSEHVLLSFFFNARGTSLETSSEGLYRSLLFQLLRKLPNLWPAVEIPHTFDKGHTLPAAILQGIFRATILHIKQERLILVIDALDEGIQKEVRKMVQFLGGLAETTNSKGIQFEICFASRHYPSITMRHCEELVVEGQDAHAKSIRIYVSENLNIEPVSRQFLFIEEIVRKSRSVFIWVVLVVRLLNEQSDGGATHTRFLETLVKIPEDLDDLLHRVLVDGASDVCLLPTLQWVLVGYDGLSLEALYFGVQTALGRMTTPTWDRDEVDLPGMERFVLNSSKGLVEVVLRDPDLGDALTVQFVHESVREHVIAGGLQFLDSRSDSNPEATAHARIAEHCQEYLRLDPSSYLDNRCTREEAIETFSNYIVYVLSKLLRHIKAAFLRGRFRLKMLQGFPREELININNVFPRNEGIYLSASTSMLDLLVNGGCSQIAHAAIELYQRSSHVATPGYASLDPLDIATAYEIIGQSLTVPCGGLYGSPLSAAAGCGDMAVVQLLLDCGANINTGGRVQGGTLTSAIFLGHEDVVKLLLQRGAKINVDGDIHHDPLHCAAMCNSVETLKLLLPYSVDLHQLRSCLVEAARHGAYNTVKLLLEEMSHSALDTCGESLDFPQSCHSALEAAIEERDEPRVVQLLLGRGGCPGIRGLDKLLMASATRCQQVNVGVLLRSGANPNSRDKDGWTVLMLAINSEWPSYDDYYQDRQASTLRALVASGADINATGGDHGTALILASAKGKDWAVRLLLRYKADVSCRSEKYGTAIEAARIGGYDEIFKMLSEIRLHDTSETTGQGSDSSPEQSRIVDEEEDLE